MYTGPGIPVTALKYQKKCGLCRDTFSTVKNSINYCPKCRTILKKGDNDEEDVI